MEPGFRLAPRALRPSDREVGLFAPGLRNQDSPPRYFWTDRTPHNLRLASARDALYNAAGTPIRFDPTGRAARDELDVVLNFIVNPHADWQLGVSHLWAGTFVERTARTPAQAQDSSFFYSQFTFRF